MSARIQARLDALCDQHGVPAPHVYSRDWFAAALVSEPPPRSSTASHRSWLTLRRQLAAVRGTGERTTDLVGHIEGDNPLEPTADGRHVWSARYSEENTATVWELPTGRLLCTLAGHTDTVFCLAMTPDGRQEHADKPERLT